MMRWRNRYWVVMVVVVLLCSAWLMMGIEKTHLFSDEYLVYQFTSPSLVETVNFLWQQDVHPPLWFSFFWAWRRLAGDSEFAGRYQAIMFSLISLSMLYQLARQAFAKRWTGLVSVGVVVTGALFYHYALEIRPYGLAMLLATFSMFCLYRWLARRTRLMAVCYGLSVALMLYVHYFTFLLVATQMLYAAAWLIREWRVGRGQLRERALQVGIIGIVVVVCFGVWLPNALYQMKHLHEVELSSGSARVSAGSSVTTQASTWENIVALANSATNGLIALYGALLLLGFWLLRNKRQVYGLAVIWGIGVPVVTVIANLVVAVFAPRYIVHFTLGLGLLAGAAIGVLPRKLSALAAVGFIAVNAYALPSFLPDRVTPYRDIFRQIAADFQAGDVLWLVDHPTAASDAFWWQFQHYLPENAQTAWTYEAGVAKQARRVWFITEDWFNDQSQPLFKELEPTHPLQKVLGKCDRQWCMLAQLMVAPPLTAPQVFGGEMPFWGVDWTATDAQTLHVRLWWRAEATPSKSYSIGLQVLGADGQLMAQTDGTINDYGKESVETNQMQAGQIYVDERDVKLPAGLPSGAYAVVLVVYDWQTGERLRLPDGQDQLSLEALTLPMDCDGSENLC